MAQSNTMPLVGHLAESIVLRESIRARTTVAPISVFATFFSIVLFIPFLLNLGVPVGRIALWALPIMLLMVARGFLSKRVQDQLDGYSQEQLSKADQMLRISSAANQIMVGLSVWIVQSPVDDTYAVPMFMTLIVAIWSIGVMANLFSDFQTFIVTMPLMIGLNAGFWIIQGGLGISIGLSMLLAAILMVLLVRRGSEIFHDSVLMRFEKDQLLENVKAEREKTQEALREAQIASDSKTYFMAAASHDIKQPLYALGMLTEALLMSDLPTTSVQLLKSQRDSIAQMSDQFDELMDMGRLDGHGFTVNLESIGLAELCSRFDLEIASLCARKELAWNLQVDEVMISTDRVLLQRLIQNLLNNAVRYTEKGQISCIARTVGGHVEFLIEDTGQGIPQEHQQVVFNEYVRLRNDGVAVDGVGLGLSIVEKINQALSLNLKMSSVPDQGTQFTFRVPVSLE